MCQGVATFFPKSALKNQLTKSSIREERKEEERREVGKRESRGMEK